MSEAKTLSFTVEYLRRALGRRAEPDTGPPPTIARIGPPETPLAMARRMVREGNKIRIERATGLDARAVAVIIRDEERKMDREWFKQRKKRFGPKRGRGFPAFKLTKE